MLFSVPSEASAGFCSRSVCLRNHRIPFFDRSGYRAVSDREEKRLYGKRKREGLEEVCRRQCGICGKCGGECGVAVG